MCTQRILFLVCVLSSTSYLGSVFDPLDYTFDDNVINELKAGLEAMTRCEQEVGGSNGALIVYKQFLQDLQTCPPSELFKSDHYRDIRKVVAYFYELVEDDGAYRNALMLALTNKNPYKIKDTWDGVIKAGIDVLTYQVARCGIKTTGETDHVQFLKKNHNLNPHTQGKYIIATCIIRCIFLQLRNERVKHINNALIQKGRIQ